VRLGRQELFTYRSFGGISGRKREHVLVEKSRGKKQGSVLPSKLKTHNLIGNYRLWGSRP